MVGLKIVGELPSAASALQKSVWHAHSRKMAVAVAQHVSVSVLDVPEIRMGVDAPTTEVYLHKDVPKDLFSSQETLVDSSQRFERKLGDSELSYFLPSRESGVNDMYLHLGFRAAPSAVARIRMQAVWAILRMRHPLLASKIEVHGYDDVRFVFAAPVSPGDALIDAGDNIEYRTQSKNELIDSYLNGPRTLSNDRLSYLILSQPTRLAAEAGAGRTTSHQYELLICAAHFLGDGMALHQFANDFFGLLGSPKTQAELELLLQNEWQSRWNKTIDETAALPQSLEQKLPLEQPGRFRRAAARVDFQKSQESLIGGHSFPRRSRLPRHTIVPTVSFDETRTKKMIKCCKAHGVSISSALFAICNIAWAKTSNKDWELPMMMYSALNLRPYLTAECSLSDSYWFLAVGYFNVILPAFLPRSGDSGDVEKTFWLRARAAKAQSTHAAKHPLIVSRSREMARERGARARGWAKEDDDKARGVWQAPPPTALKAPPRAPSTALLGLSLLGNLDGIYKHGESPDIHLNTLTTGSRQRGGGMLLFGYTFVGKLWVSLGYDENGFEKDVVETFWGNVLQAVDVLLAG